MPLNPETRAFLDSLAQMGRPPLNELEPAQAREQYSNGARLLSHEKEPLAQVEDLTIKGPVGEIPIRIYRPAVAAALPILMYFHGGGWVVGDLEVEDSVCRTLAKQADCIVVSVDYRKAPEHKFPAAPEDAYAATIWVAENAALIKGDRTRIGVGGESAGGNLAAAVTLMARDRGGPSLVYQLLFDPVTQYGFDTESYRQYGKDYLLTTDIMVWFWNHYLPTPLEGKNPYASPLLAENLSNLPPASIITAEFDPLRDEAEAYGDRLRQAGVPVKISRYQGEIHAFTTRAKICPQGLESLAEASSALKAAFYG